MQKQFAKIFFLLAIFLMLPKNSQASVIFEDNFDGFATDWNATGQYDGNECSALGFGSFAQCAANTYPGNWNLYSGNPDISRESFSPDLWSIKSFKTKLLKR